MNELPSPNWKLYKILDNHKYLEPDIETTISKSNFKKNEITQKAIDQMWSEMVYGRKSVNQETWDSTIYRLNSFKRDNNKLHLDLAEGSYKELQGTNATYWLLGDIYGHEYLMNGILVASLIYDKDDNLIMGKRNTGVKKEFERYAIFGGTMDKTAKSGSEIKDGANPFAVMKIELKEELGITETDINELYINWIIEDKKYYPILIFITKLNISFEEIEKKFIENNDVEHSSIEIITKEKINDLLDNHPEQVIGNALIALDLVRKFDN